MKKAIITIIIILASGIIVFIAGLISVPANAYCVIHTAFSGFEDKILPPGSFSWRWERLLPTVLQTFTFDLSPYTMNAELILKGDFSPQDGGLLESDSDRIQFDRGAGYSVSFSVIPEKLKGLVVSGLRPEKLADWHKETASSLTKRISRIILDESNIFTQEDFTGKISGLIKDDPRLGSIRIISIIPERVDLPDYQIYLELKRRYFEIERLKLEAEVEKLAAEKERDLLAIKKEIEIIQNLDRYGEMFANYPILLEFLYMRNLKPEEFIKLSDTNLKYAK